MFKTTALDSVGNQYVDKDVGTSTPGTRLEADDRNIIQDELVNLVEGRGLTLDPTGVNRDQIHEAVVRRYENIWIPAGAMIPLTTNGAFSKTNEYATNDIMLDLFAFDGATEEFVAFNIIMPEGWDKGAIKSKFFWSPGDPACSAGDKVEWKLGGVAISDDDPIDVAIGTPQVIFDTVLAGKDADLHLTGATPAITIGGTPTLGDLIHFKASRNVSSADDNMTEDAWLFGIWIQILLDQFVPAW